MECCLITVSYLQSSGEVGKFRACIRPEDFKETIPSLLKFVSSELGKVVEYVIGAVVYH